MKKEMMILLVIVSSVMILSASGKQDDSENQFFGRGAGRGASDADRETFFEQSLADLELISITGSLKLVNGELPTIDSNGTTYQIMAPWTQVQDLELTNEMNVSLEGYEMPGRPLQWDSAEKSLIVTKALINGEEIVIDHEPGTYGMMGAGGPGKGGAAGNGGMMGRRS
ncbi:MAG: hypothetical protein PF518_19560 [Spirochaetaceae bacterium]|jgi:hypothetical protein|nr:hypothetical protein [Spirochaetaceae bacterium]